MYIYLCAQKLVILCHLLAAPPFHPRTGVGMGMIVTLSGEAPKEVSAISSRFSTSNAQVLGQHKIVHF